MPYIKLKRRREIDPTLEEFLEVVITPDITVGDANYIITRILDRCLSHIGKSYNNLNAVIGVLECAKLELYRRIVSPYEDSKRGENGDVYIDSKAY